MEFALTDEQKMLKQTIRHFLDKECPSEFVRKCDEEQIYPEELYQKMAEMGMFGLPYPEEYGGSNSPVLDFLMVAEEVGYTDFDIAAMYGQSIFLGLSVLKWGTEEQKRRLIPGVIRGTQRLSISITEPNAGSDVGNIQTQAVPETTAEPDGDYFMINGQKVFSTGAHLDNNLICVVCRTDKTVDYHKGMSVFLVDSSTPGVELRRLNTLGRKIVGTNEIFFNDVRVHKDQLLGPLNQGWDVVMGSLGLERLFNCAAYTGCAQRVLDEAVEYAKQRVQFGKPIGNFQAIAHMLADVRAEIEAARLLTYRAGWLYSQGERCMTEISIAKLYGSETFQKATEVGMQVMGGYAYTMESNMQRYFRDARILTVSGGSSQMQRNAIARSMGLKPQ